MKARTYNNFNYQKIINILKDCTTRVHLRGEQNNWGTGFFIARNTLITCAHVLGDRPIDIDCRQSQVIITWRDSEHLVKKVTYPKNSNIDLVILTIATSLESHPCVLLEKNMESFESLDSFYTYGYPKSDERSFHGTYEPEPSSSKYKWDGKIDELQSNSSNIKLKDGRVRSGQSGAPLLNERTGKICGVIQFSSRMDNGGGAVPVGYVYENFPDLKHLLVREEQLNSKWRDLIYEKSPFSKQIVSFIVVFFAVSISIKSFLFVDPLLNFRRDLDTQTNAIALHVVPGKPLLASIGGHNPLRIWNLRTLKQDNYFKDASSNALSIAINNTGRVIATGHGNFRDDQKSLESSIKIWNLESGKLIKTLNGHTKQVRSLSFSPNGEHLVSGSHDRTIKIWNVKSGKLETSIDAHEDHITSVAWSHNGKIIATASDDKSIKIWDAENYELYGVLKGHQGEILSVIFSEDDKVLISSSGEDRYTHQLENCIKIWDISKIKDNKSIESNLLKQTLVGHSGWVWSVSLSPDGRKVVSSSYDNSIRVWSLVDFKLIGIGAKHTKAVYSSVFSPNGKEIFSSSDDGTIKIWEIPPSK